ncbi:glycosyltransferase family 2 protein, partial [Campylobacter peloridis]|nr:glycosyltransferase family 2 protein [Campylobacter peloridis]
YVNFVFCENFFVSKKCFYHYEFNEFGRYENKNKEILWQNYEYKKQSLKCIKKLANIFPYKHFNEKILEVLEKEILGLESRILNILTF